MPSPRLARSMRQRIKRMKVERHEARLMGPAFKELAVFVVETALVQSAAIVVAQAGIERQIMRTHQHIDAVDLQ